MLPESVVLEMVFVPELLRTMLLALVVNAPTAPLPPFKVSVSPRSVPADCEMVPAFVAVSVTEVGPVTVPPNEMDPAPAEVDASEIVLLAVKTPVDKFWSLVRTSEPTVPLTAKFEPDKVVFETVAAPPELKTTALAVVFSAPIAPVPPFKLTVAPCTVPADCVMVPAFVAVRVTDVGPTTLPPREMLPLPADVDLSTAVVAAVIAPVVVILPVAVNDTNPVVAVMPPLVM